MNAHIYRTIIDTYGQTVTVPFSTTVHGTVFYNQSVFICKYRVIAGYYTCATYSCWTSSGHAYWRTQGISNPQIASDSTRFVVDIEELGCGMAQYNSGSVHEMRLTFSTPGGVYAQKILGFFDLYVTGP